MLRRLNSFSCSDCEQNWFLGRAGKCDLENEVCICPKGFSGIDAITVTQTCHINEAVAKVLYWILFLFPLLPFTIIGIYLHIFKQHRTVEKWIFKVKRIQILTFRAAYFALGYLWFTSLIGALYAFPQEMVSFKDYKIIAPTLFAIVSVLQASAYTMIYLAWYYSLPDPERYGKLFGYPELIIKKPHLVPYTIYATVFLWATFGITCFIILPLFDEEENYGSTPATVFLICYPLFTITAFIGVTLTVIALFGLYRNAREAAIDDPDPKTRTINGLSDQLGAIERSIKGLRLYRPVTIIISIPVLFFGIVSLATGGLYQYLLISFIGINLSFGCVIMALLTAETTNGGYLIRNN